MIRGCDDTFKRVWEFSQLKLTIIANCFGRPRKPNRLKQILFIVICNATWSCGHWKRISCLWTVRLLLWVKSYTSPPYRQWPDTATRSLWTSPTAVLKQQGWKEEKRKETSLHRFVDLNTVHGFREMVTWEIHRIASCITWQWHIGAVAWNSQCRCTSSAVLLLVLTVCRKVLKASQNRPWHDAILGETL